MMQSEISLGLGVNIRQISMQLVQIFLVGLTIGMTRVVVPGMAESEFGLAKNSFVLLTTFVVVFGVIKALMNLWAGHLSDQYGRRSVLIVGWLVALPIPFVLYWAPTWNWVVAATVLLGLNQGLAWSMALNSKLDLAKSSQKGLINGLNEFAGYAAVGLAGFVTAIFVELYGARMGLFFFSTGVISVGLLLAIFTVKETLPWAALHHQALEGQPGQTGQASLLQLFKYASWQHKPLIALNQAGLVEKFTDALIWVFLPVFLIDRGLSLLQAGAVIALYGLTWGALQLITGPLSDYLGRKGLIFCGMIVCGVSVIAIPLTNSLEIWSFELVMVGVGMAMLYPNLGAAVGDFSPSSSRASLVGVYRFWRDSGYAIGALLMGLLAQWTNNMEVPFMFVGLSMVVSALWLWVWMPSQKKLNQDQ